MKLLENIEDERLNPCPICGGKAYYNKIVLSTGCNRTGVPPEGAYIARTTPSGTRTLEEAIEEWNNPPKAEI